MKQDNLNDVLTKYKKNGLMVKKKKKTINALYSDPCVFEAWYEEVAE